MVEDLASLLEKVRQGDEFAFDVLSREYKSVVDNAVRRFAPSFGIVNGNGSELYNEDDLRQYASIALYKAASTYDPEGKGKNVSFGLYTKICINNALISQLRKYKSEIRRREVALNAERTIKRTASADPLVHLADHADATELLDRISVILSDYEKEIFDYYIEGKSVGEIAERLGKEEKSVSNALYRMKVKVKGLLKNQ